MQISRIIFANLGLLVIASTFYDLQHSGEKNKLFVIFSAYTNGKKLFDVTRPEQSRSIECLNGIRALSTLWIIFGHRVVLQTVYPTLNRSSIPQHYDQLSSVVWSNYDKAVETFLVMAALLLTMSTLRTLDKKQRLNVPRMILHRYIRYTPVFAVLILYTVSLSKFTGQGPLEAFESTFPLSIRGTEDKCSRYWWSALLHVQNYINPENQCGDHAWYLSVDFQLSIISPFLVYAIWKYGWKFAWTLLVLAIASSAYNAAVYLREDLRPLLISFYSHADYRLLLYAGTHSRIGSWLVGMVLGFVMHNAREKTVRISDFANAMLWIVTLSLLAALTFFSQPFNSMTHQMPLLETAAYQSFHRLAWAIGIATMIFACQVLKTGGLIRWFLSLPEWQPIGRMSLSIFLVHVFYLFTTFSSLKEPIGFEIMSLVSFKHSIFIDSIIFIFCYSFTRISVMLLWQCFWEQFST